MNNEELTLDYHEHASQMHEGMDFNSDVWQGIPDVPTEEEELQRQKLAETEALKAKDQGLIANNPIQAVQEVGSAIVGGAADAVESVGGFADALSDAVGGTAQGGGEPEDGVELGEVAGGRNDRDPGFTAGNVQRGCHLRGAPQRVGHQDQGRSL